MFDAIPANGEANMLFVAAAGSGGGVEYPAKFNLDNIIAVAATDDTDALASFSSRGNGVDLGAPGVDILSTMKQNTRYGTFSGTSMASPHVAGVAALTWDGLDGTAFDDYRIVRDVIFAGVDPLPALSDLTETGGRLNAYTTLVIAEALLGNATTISIDDVSRLEGDTGNLFRPRDITFGPDGNLYVADMGNDQVLLYDGATGTFIDDIVPTGSEGLDLPEDLKFAGGDLFVASALSGEVLRYDGTTGAFIEVYVAAESGGLGRPSSILFTQQGNLLVGNNAVFLYGAASQAAFTVSLSHPVGRTVTVDLFTADDTATAGLDYTAIPAASPRTFTFAPGETSLSLLLPTLHDVLVEPSETFSVNLTNLSGANPGDLTGVGTILDNEPPPPPSPSFSISDVIVNEADGTATFTVTRSGDTSNTDTVDFVTADGPATDGAIAPDDYVSSSDTLTFDPSVASLPVQVTIIDDLVEESAETFFVNLINSSIGTSISDAQGEGTILDNDSPSGGSDDIYVWDIAFRNSPEIDSRYQVVSGIAV